MSLLRKALLGASHLTALEDGEVEGIFSTEGVDEMGDVVVQAGIDTSTFSRNPILLWNHNADHPIGTVKTFGLNAAGQFSGRVKLAVEVSPKAREIYDLVKADVVKSFSIGFMPVETQPIDQSRPKGAQRYIKSDLFELSLVSIPANSSAIVTDKSMEVTMADTKPTGSTETIVTRAHKPLAFKGLYDVGRLAALMGELNWQHDSSVWEEACEGDVDSVVPGKLAEVLHMLGETLIAMTAEEVKECLTNTDARMDCLDDTLDVVEVVELSTAPAVRKLRAGVLMATVTKAGKKVSAATAQLMQDAMESHGDLDKAVKAHSKCMKALGAATPGNLSDAASEADATHVAMTNAMKTHTKCMKALNEIVPGADGSEDTQSTTEGDGKDGETSEKSAKPALTKAQMKRRAAALALSAVA